MDFRLRMVSQTSNQSNQDVTKQRKFFHKKHIQDQKSNSLKKTLPRHFSSSNFRNHTNYMQIIGSIKSPQYNAMKNLFINNKQSSRLVKNSSVDFQFKFSAPKTRRRIVTETQEKKFSQQLTKFPSFNFKNLKPKPTLNLKPKNKQYNTALFKDLSSLTSNNWPFIQNQQFKFKIPPKIASLSKEIPNVQKETLNNQIMQGLSKNNIFEQIKNTNKHMNLPINPEKPLNKYLSSPQKQKSPPQPTSYTYNPTSSPKNRRMAPQKKQLNKIKKSDFQIGKTLGKGKYGQVMIVRHKKTGFLCAMKIMSKKVIKQQDYVNQIVRQLSIQFYITHRNIAPLYGYFYDDQYVYLLVQLCEGGQLYSKIKKQKKLAQKQTSKIIKQVLEGLDFIHKLQIIHRDLKPENILFNYNLVKISDFGWAVYHGQGLRKTVSGSPLYYPPQIVKGQLYDEKIDLWNVGMMTYQCILGKIPFRIYSQHDLNKIVSDEIKFPEYADVSDLAKDFILKTMRKNPEQRIQIRQMLRHKFIKQYDQNNINPELQQDFNQLMQR